MQSYCNFWTQRWIYFYKSSDFKNEHIYYIDYIDTSQNRWFLSQKCTLCYDLIKKCPNCAYRIKFVISKHDVHYANHCIIFIKQDTERNFNSLFLPSRTDFCLLWCIFAFWRYRSVHCDNMIKLSTFSRGLQEINTHFT